MRRVLFLAYYYPPDGGAGAQRAAKFARYLPEHGWDPVVVAPRPEHDVEDPTLQDEVRSVAVHRVAGFQPLLLWRRFRSEGRAAGGQGCGPAAGGAGRSLRGWLRRVVLFPDEAVYWTPAAVRAATRLAAETGAEAILATQPNSLLLAGAFLASRLGLPLVSDFRDVWTTLVPGRGPVTFREVLERPLEARVLRSSAAVLCNTPRMLEGFGLRYPEARSVLRHLPNGYDPADFPSDAPCRTGASPRSGPADRPLEVAYAGAFYGDYNPLAFLRGLGRALREGLVPPGGVRARFYGAHDRAVAEAIDAVAREEGVADLVARPGVLSHADAVAALLEADLLLLVIPPGPEAAARITAKSYEILAAGRPVLAMVPPGDARDLVESSGAALAVVGSADAAGAARALGLACRRLREGTLQAETRWEVVRRYDRRAQAAELAGILEEVAGPSS